VYIHTYTCAVLRASKGAFEAGEEVVSQVPLSVVLLLWSIHCVTFDGTWLAERGCVNGVADVTPVMPTSFTGR